MSLKKHIPGRRVNTNCYLWSPDTDAFTPAEAVAVAKKLTSFYLRMNPAKAASVPSIISGYKNAKGAWGRM